jgi:hypothetical protein
MEINTSYIITSHAPGDRRMIDLITRKGMMSNRRTTPNPHTAAGSLTNYLLSNISQNQNKKN